ncbi:MAG: RDD family protein [Planctomycetes bacterium]|nr:RDD family protein [Planctomycetota bacterium]
MVDRTDEFVFVGFWKRVLAALIDAAIGWAFMPITMPLMTWTITHRNIVPGALWSLVWTTVWLWLVVRFGGTPGKLIIRVRIVDARGTFLSWGRAIRRVIFPSLIMTINSHLQMWKALSTYPDSTPHSSFLEIGELMNKYGQPFAMITMVLGLAIYADIGVVLFNRKKRAFHDFIAGSYVITKKSYRNLAEPTDGQLSSESASSASPEEVSP